MSSRIDWIEQRLLNWQRWCLQAETKHGLGFARSRLIRTGSRHSGYWQTRIPIDDCEAAETDAAVRTLVAPLAATLIEYYLGRGGEFEHIRELNCSRDTLYKRIRRAQSFLAEHFAALRRVRDEERFRVERLREII